MRVLVIGAGRTGIFWATLFSRGGADVTLLMKPEQLAAIPNPTDRLAFGIEWRQGDEGLIEWPARNIRVITRTGEIDPKRWWVIVAAVRDYALESAVRPVIEQLRPMIDALVVPTNGVWGEFAASSVFHRDDRIVSATLTYPCDRHPSRPGWIQVFKPIGAGGIGLAPYEDLKTVRARPMPAFDRIMDRLCSIQDGPSVTVYPIMYEMKLTKLLLNMIGNALPAILDWPAETVYRDLRLCRLELRLIGELLQSMQPIGQRRALSFVDLPGYSHRTLQPLLWLARLEGWIDRSGLPSWLYRRHIAPRIVRARGGKPPSLAQELAAGRSQCENLHRDFVRITRAMTGWQPSLHQRLGEILDQCFGQPGIWAQFRNDPDRLIGELESQQAVDWQAPYPIFRN